MDTRETTGRAVGGSVSIPDDTPCRKCGYNLRGLMPEGRCPECGTPIGLSLHGRLLRYADPAWVEGLARGVNLILWGLLLTLLGGFIGGLIGAALGVGRNILPGLLPLVGGLLGAYGAWLLTEPDPSGIGEDEYGRIRRVTRLAVVIGVVASLLNLITSAAPAAGVVLLLIGIVAAVGALIGWVGEFCKFWFMEKLALRIPEVAISKRARFLRWAMCFTGMALVVVLAIGALGVWTAAAGAGPVLPASGGVIVRPGGGRARVTITTPAGTRTTASTAGSGLVMVAGCGGGVLALAMLVLTLLAVRMQWLLRNALREQARYARQTWAAATQPSRPPPVPPETT